MKRVTLFAAYVEEAQKIVKKTRNPLAKKALQFCTSGFVYTVGGKPGKKKHTTKFVMSFLGDPKPNPRLKKVLFKEALGQFIPSHHILILYGKSPLSPSTRGFVFLRECMYCMRHYDNHDHPRMSKGVVTKYYEDSVAVTDFMLKLVRQYGKKAYQNLLQREIGRLRNIHSRQNIPLGSRWVGPLKGAYTTTLNAIFGKSRNAKENVERLHLLWTDAYFTLIETGKKKVFQLKVLTLIQLALATGTGPAQIK